MAAADEVRQASERFYAALNRMANGDASAMSAAWAHGGEVTAMHPIGERSEGWEQVRSSFDQVASLASGGQVRLRDQLISGILESVEGAHLTGSPTHRLDSHASFVLPGVEAEGVLIALDLAGVAASSGSACTSGAQRPSHVLEAIGVPARHAVGGLRLSLGHSNTPENIEYVLEKLPQIVAQIKETF